MSAIAYEPPENVSDTLAHFFPGWWVHKHHPANDSAAEKGWTTFYEFVDPQNTTSVIAIRGTASNLDKLDDVSLWLPSVLLQVFDAIGFFTTLGPLAQAVGFWTSLLQTTKSSEAFEDLLKYARRRTRKNPAIRFYFTGHSLGGGVAKFVAGHVKRPAITFMAPGVARAIYFDSDAGDLLRNVTPALHFLTEHAVTVQPKNDIISRIDEQVGSVIETSCSEDWLTCHEMWPALICPLFLECGSMRRPGAPGILLPRGQCGDKYKDFKELQCKEDHSR